MDDKRFDSLVRLVGHGASRRAILKGLLGLGGSAAVGGAILSDSDARTVGTRPTIPPPPSPTPKPIVTPTQTPTPTPDPCLGFRCGLDCCSGELQCCDGECCPADTVCLTRVFPEGPFVEEETCCATELTCDNRCCDGVCFRDPSEVFPSGINPFQRTCCPAAATYCPHALDPAFGACCLGETSNCCHDSQGNPVCITSGQCCTDDDCIESGFDRDCVTCNVDSNTCVPANENATCADFECGICQSGNCAPDESLCFACEQCSAELRCAPDCRGSGCGCDICETCNQETGACDLLCSDTQTCCFDVCFEGAGQACCFNDNDCTSACQTCQLKPGTQVGICGSACTTEHPKCCANQFTSICAAEDTTCCAGDEDCHEIPTYCELQPDGDLLWRYHLCSGSICVLTAHPCNNANNVCERDTCGATTDCGVEDIPPGELATDGVSICCDQQSDCAGLTTFCDDDDLFHYYLCNGISCQATARQCSVGLCDPLLGCLAIGQEV